MLYQEPEGLMRPYMLEAVIEVGGADNPRGARREWRRDMKITSIHTHYVRIPFDMGAPRHDFAGLRFPTMDHLLVQVETDAGITGWGEGFGHSIIPATKTALE